MNVLCAREREFPAAGLPSRPAGPLDRMTQGADEAAGGILLTAIGEDGEIIVSAELLPTSSRCLIDEFFPRLLNGLAPPCNETVWELSHWPDLDFVSDTAGLGQLALCLLLQGLQFGAARGMKQLLTIASPALERLLLRAGLELQRVGPPTMIDDRPKLAVVIEVNDRSIAALVAVDKIRRWRCAEARQRLNPGASYV